MDLKELHEFREGGKAFQRRNAAYHLFETTYNSEKENPDQRFAALDLTYRPTNVDIPGSDGQGGIVINQVRRVGSHFAGLFSRPPRLVCWPPDGNQAQAETMASMVLSVFRRSDLIGLQPQQAWRLALRGDAVYAVDWEPTEGKQPKVMVKAFDPKHCYPEFSPDDLGRVENVLIAQRVNRAWAEAKFGVKLDEDDEPNLYRYWDDSEYQVQIGEHKLPRLGRKHDLGFCPFRWVFGDPSGLMAQADVREVPKLQATYNEGLLLALDAIRRSVDPAYYATGVAKDITPEPGVANALPEGASVGMWPISAEPQIILGTMDHLEASIQSTTGVSPISSTGASRQSQSSGAAVRHQVEAIEQRTETRKVLLETAFARLGEMVLEVSRKIYPQEVLSYRGEKQGSLQGADIPEGVECEALYGGFIGLSLDARVQIALAGLGKLWDEQYALSSILDAPGTTGEAMVERLHQHQIQQAKYAAEAQQAAQQAMGGGQGASPEQALQGSPTTRKRQGAGGKPPGMQQIAGLLGGAK